MKYLIEDTTLTAIGDAVRTKGETTELIKVSELANAITNLPTGSEPVLRDLVVNINGIFNPPDGIDGFNTVTVNVPSGGGGDIPEEVLNITGNCDYRFSYNGWNWFINEFGNQITTNNITSAVNMFSLTTELELIPFEINLTTSTSSLRINYMFKECSNLKEVPIVRCEVKNLPTSNYSGIINMDNMFNSCYLLREISYDYFSQMVSNPDYWEQSRFYEGTRGNLFNYCYSLRELPDISMLLSADTRTDCLYYGLCNNNFNLNKIINLPVLDTIALTSNSFNYIANNTMRLEDFTFAVNEDGTPKTAEWKSQVIDLSVKVGYDESYWGNDTPSSSNIVQYNSGITVDTCVYDDATYQALKDNPDWWAYSKDYSRYNRTSAVNTINSLPDTSAYGTNTVKFLGAAGALTDGGAINTLTEEEIAVATARGWTVSLV